MKKVGKGLELSATDLVGHLSCRELTALDRAVAEGRLSRPKVWDPLLQVLAERGSIHEKNFVAHLSSLGLGAVKIDGTDVSDDAVAETHSAMKRGIPVIIQAALRHNGWNGRPDILRRVEVPSHLGPWSYEATDTKLARETKAGTIVQLCVYSELLGIAQGQPPEYMNVVAPWSEFQPQRYRFTDYAAYFRKGARALEQAVASSGAEQIYPEPKLLCDICRWRIDCDKRRRADDHLCLVAGISKVQTNELRRHSVTTVKALAEAQLPLAWKPERGSAASYVRIREQARVQVEARRSGAGQHELLSIEEGYGLTCLPVPSDGDIFLDFEGDPFVGEHGLEYLCGYLFIDGTPIYKGDWAFSRADEKRTFETFVDFVMKRWKMFPDLHIYHYSPYEPAALKRLMGRYATREEEIDQMLRSKLFVDLYSVVRRSLRASVESYSLKQLEPFHGLERKIPLPDASRALANLQAHLELEDIPSISDGVKATVLAYNEDDCRSASSLRTWLETLRDQVIAEGKSVPRPKPSNDTATEKVTDWLIKINNLSSRLTAGVSEDPTERDADQTARRLLANILDWHRREKKAVWWEYFRLSDLSAEDLLDERAGLAGLTFVEPIGGTTKAPVHRYRFPPQETEFRGDEDLRSVGGEELGTVVAVSFGDSTVDIKKRKDTATFHPEAVFAHKVIGTQVCADALVRIGEHVATHGLHGQGLYPAARDLLLRTAPRLGAAKLRGSSETTLDAAVRITGHLAGGILPIQGPPGSGKTFTGAHMICELIRQGKTVGITANSHKVIRNLIDECIKLADKLGVDVRCCHKADEVEPAQHRLTFAKKSEDLLQGLRSAFNVGGGTAWLWSRLDACESVDVLFVDEAAQMSLANVLAVSQAARTVVLIGDPQQLDQPTQGSHPEGTDVSALHHLLDGAPTISPDKGLFLEETWRLHPQICAFTSELFYSGKLKSKPGLERQAVRSAGPLNGSGLRYLAVQHSGNQNCSDEEADAIAKVVEAVLANGPTWVDGDGKEHPLSLQGNRIWPEGMVLAKLRNMDS